MPYINLNGQLIEVTQEQYDIYTVGQTVNPGTVSVPITSAANVASGGNVAISNSITTPVLTPNTSISIPGLTLPTTAQTVDTTPAATNFGTTTQVFDDGSAIQTFDDGSVLVTNSDGTYSSTPATTTSDPVVDAQTSARSGLTGEQLSALGNADATDPFIRARLGLPAISEAQTLSGAIGNINFGDYGNAIGNAFDSVSSSFGNAVTSVSDYFSSTGSNTVPVSSIDTSPTPTNYGTTTQVFDDGSEIQTFDDGSVLVTDTDGTLTSSTSAPADAADGYYNQLVQTFSEADVQTSPSPFAPVASLSDTPIVPSGQVTIESAGDQYNLPSEVTSGFYDNTPVVVDGTQLPDEVPVSEIDNTPADVTDLDGYATQEGVDVPATEVEFSAGDVTDLDGYATQEGVDVLDSDLYTGQDSFTADELNSIADAQGVAGEEGFITNDIYSGQESLTPEELDAIARAQGVAGEEGFITSDLYSGQSSLTPEELDAIARAQGVSGEEGFITSDLYSGQSSLTPEELDAIAAAQGVDAGDVTDTGITEQFLYDNEEASQTAAFANQARQQQTIAAQRKQVNNVADWRVRLRLAPQSKYLYNAPSPGILAPLTITDGVIFPYTPSISTSYKANYSSYDLTHSNFRGYFYQNSYVDAININATFTAQDTSEANYLLAVIHFFRSATKMFYGQDAERGSPPPLTYLSGLGEYQFNEHPCLIQNFTYNLPADVDYIRAGSVTNSGTNLTTNRDRQSVATQGVFGSLNRLAAAFLTKGAIPGVRAPGLLQINNPTYVPTRMEIQITLLPIQSRQQVSKQFSVKNFANGNLLKGGFW